MHRCKSRNSNEEPPEHTRCSGWGRGELMLRRINRVRENDSAVQSCRYRQHAGNPKENSKSCSDPAQRFRWHEYSTCDPGVSAQLRIINDHGKKGPRLYTAALLDKLPGYDHRRSKCPTAALHKPCLYRIRIALA
jgi:hypothetical protein